jgi:hypothetical protein
MLAKLANQMVVLSGLNSLMIASKDGAPGNEYRIQEGEVKFRAINPNGEPYNHPNGRWRVLDDDEIGLHFALQTPVANWLDKNLYSSAAAA